MFIDLIVLMCTWVYTYIKTYQTVCFKYMQFSLFQLYFNKDFFKKQERQSLEMATNSDHKKGCKSNNAFFLKIAVIPSVCAEERCSVG